VELAARVIVLNLPNILALILFRYILYFFSCLPSIMMQDGDDCASLSDDRKGVAMIHEDICFVCDGNQMPLVFCSFCPKSYHEGCLPKGTAITSPRWGCPAHKCATCNATTSSSRGRLFRCKSCPSGYCKHHVPEGSTILKHNPLSAYGYKCSSYTWLLCKSCKDRGVPEEDHDHGAVDEHAAVARALPVLRSTPEPSIIHSIKKAIRKYSLSQKDIASQVEISQTRLSQFLNGAERSNGWKAVEQKLLNWLNSLAHAHNDSPHDDMASSHSSGEEGASDTACGGDDEEFVRPQKRRRLSYEPQARVAACPPLQPVHAAPQNASNVKLLVPQVSMLEQSRMYNNNSSGYGHAHHAAGPKFAVPLSRSFIKQEPIMMSSYHVPHAAAPFPVYAQPLVPQFVALSAPHAVPCEEYYVPAAPSPVPCYSSYASEYAGDIQYLLSEQPSAPMESFDSYFPAPTEAYNSGVYQSGAIDIFGM
jgi:transcriptional regulator with XRE-family HTH domain